MKNTVISKLAIGTVQFGLDYGISNKSGKTSAKEVQKILNVGQANGIAILDTAFAYGESEKVLGSLDLKKFKVVSKFPPNSEGNIKPYLDKSLELLNLEAIHGYLAHNAIDLIDRPILWDELLSLKEKGKTSKIGFSLYHPSELEKLLNLGMMPDIIQVPYNLLDRRFENYFEDLSNSNVEIHTRSTFLQGLLLMDPATLSEYFQSITNELIQLNKGFDNLTSKIGFLIQFSLHNKYISSVVIGVNSAEQLSENIEAVRREYNYNVDINVNDESILNPSNWPSK